MAPHCPRALMSNGASIARLHLEITLMGSFVQPTGLSFATINCQLLKVEAGTSVSVKGHD